MVDTNIKVGGLESILIKVLDFMYFWKSWPVESKWMLLFAVIFALSSWIVLTYGMKMHGLNWSSANKSDEDE